VTITVPHFAALIKKEAVLIIAAMFAFISAILIPPDSGYFAYIDYSVLCILFCLMAAVAGLKKQGVFDLLSQKILARISSVKIISVLLVNCVFFCSMFVTNDVALITFVPVTIELFAGAGRKKLIFVIVMETLAANLGSMLTPIGNPQNLYIYSYYTMNILEFFRIVLPAGILGYIIIMVIMFVSKKESLEIKYNMNAEAGSKKFIFFYSVLFIFCIAAVLRALDYRICFLIVLCSVFITDKKIFSKIDYGLLLTFFCFFIFVGNLARIEYVSKALSQFLETRVLLISILGSQVISNVPAAMMLSGFTKDVRGLLLGVNIGGLGTPIASLASLISFRIYSRSKDSSPSGFLAVFTVYNVSVLILLAFVFIFT